jgi:hypothetical protein
MADGQALESFQPPAESALSSDSQPSADDAMGASLFKGHWPIEEGQIRAGTPLPVRIKKVIGRNVILIDRFLDQTHPEDTGVEGMIGTDIRCDRGKMVNPVKLHKATYTNWGSLADTRKPDARKSSRRRREPSLLRSIHPSQDTSMAIS